MRSIPAKRRRRVVSLGASAIAVLLAVTLVASAPAGGRGAQRAQRRPGTVRVNISDFAYHPKKLRVPRGTKIVFANRDSTAHTATRRGSFDTGRIRPGRSIAVRLRRAGVYAFHCSIHPFMRGRIVVR